MPKSCRIFFLEDAPSLSDFATKFGGSISEDETIPAGAKMSVKLKVSVEKLAMLEGGRMALGILFYDEPIVITHRDGTQAVDVQTLEVKFGLVERDSLHLVIFASQAFAPYIRARMGPLLAQHATHAIGVTISVQRMNAFLQSHRNTQRSCGWVGITLPGIAKARITGEDIDLTPDYRRYEQHGSKNSVMFTLHANGWTISMNAQGALTIWQDVDESQAVRFVHDEILPLCVP